MLRSPLAFGLLGLAGVACASAPPASPPPVDVHLSAVSSAPAAQPPVLETPFVRAPNWYPTCLEPLGDGRMLLGNEVDVDELDGAHVREKASGKENPFMGGEFEKVHGCGVSPTGDPLLMTSTTRGDGPPYDGLGRLYRLVSHVWVLEHWIGGSTHGIKVTGWSKGRWLLLTQDEFHPLAELEARRKEPDVPRLGRAAFNRDATAIDPADFAALPTGEVIVVGRLRTESDVANMGFGGPRVPLLPGFDDPEHQRGAWERFAPGSSKGVLEPLKWGDASLLPCCVRMRSPSEVWLAGVTSKKNGFVGKWDGAAWSFVAVDEPVTVFDVEPNGTIWAGTPTKIKRGSLSEPFETVPLPKAEREQRPPLVPTRIAVAGPGDVWVTLDGQSSIAMLRTRPTPPRQVLPVSAEEKDARARRIRPHLVDAEPTYDLSDCVGPFVIIQSGLNGEATDYTKIASALTGHAELAKAWFIEYAFQGARHFGARVPDVATGKKLVAALAKAVKPKPKLVCFEPAAVRRIELDFKTGTVARAGRP